MLGHILFFCSFFIYLDYCYDFVLLLFCSKDIFLDVVVDDFLKNVFYGKEFI